MPVHRGSGINNFYAVNIHFPPLFVDMCTTDKVKRLYMTPDTLASNMFSINFIKSLIRGGMSLKYIVNSFFHLFHGMLQYIIYLLICHFKRSTEWRWV